MKRDLYTQLLEWKKSKKRKPLLLRGARQVGKTYLLQAFGNAEYDDMIYLDFDAHPNFAQFFAKNLDPERIITDLSIYFGKQIDPEKTLLFFDEVQECPEALISLKYFCDEAPHYHVVTAGSLLGVRLKQKLGFPVGKVTFLDLYPLNFLEFLENLGKHTMREALISMNTAESLSEPIHDALLDILRSYLIVGGMPEA